MGINFVNYEGCAIDIQAAKDCAANEKPKRTSNAPAKFHKGYKVVGVDADSLDAARQYYEKENHCLWPESVKSNWIQRHKRLIKKVVLLEAAEVAKLLAEKAGWLHVEIRAIERRGS